jgi:hypothetical protein
MAVADLGRFPKTAEKGTHREPIWPVEAAAPSVVRRGGEDPDRAGGRPLASSGMDDRASDLAASAHGSRSGERCQPGRMTVSARVISRR